MKTIGLAAFGEASLADLDTARFVRGKLAPGDRLSFQGITSVSDAFLDEVLEGVAPTALEDRVVDAESVADALLRWRERHAPMHERVSSPSSPTEDDRYTPTRLVLRLRRQLARYLEGAYPLNHPVLIKARRRLLDTALEGRLLSQDPFVETTPRYRSSAKGYRELEIPRTTADLFDRLSRTVANPDLDPERTLLFPGMYEHQAAAFEAFLGRGSCTLVATGTGSGKTECFLVPVLGGLHREAAERPASFAKRGVRALILYPMNALVNDQLARLRVMFGSDAVVDCFHGLGAGGRGRHPMFGTYTGRTPYAGPRKAARDHDVGELIEHYLALPDGLRTQLDRMGRFPAKDLRAFLAPEKAVQKVYKSGKKKGQSYTEHNWDLRLRTGSGDRELMTRHESVFDPETQHGHAPDILVTNYSMLEYMLMRPFERPLFEETRRWLEDPDNRFVLVLDEAHMYRGARGAEVAFLIRRLRARLGITDRPEKLSVILTSASLGKGDNAKAVAQRFAADLTGLAPDRFEVITGEREVPERYASGDDDLAECLASIDLDALHAGASFERLRDALAPLFARAGATLAVDDEPALLRALYTFFKGHPVLNAVLKHTTAEAVALDALAEKIFPGSSYARRATEALLTLGALARPNPDEQGLLPTRVHLMFRGLAGLYGCLNPRCEGRQDSPGVEAPVGKLFAEPRAECDACHSRVFELASCRECGAVYYIAWTHLDPKRPLDFLWNESTGDLASLQLLAERPRDVAVDARVIEIEVQRSTGAVVEGVSTLPSDELRTLWVARDAESGAAAGSFKQCPMCQPPGGRRQTRVLDFRTRGEQSFTALIEAQFAEQPPQKRDPSLPNQGRKVLVFSDGRQKAARLAPALETNHAADAFRQVLAMAARSLRDTGSPAYMHQLYPAVVDVCARRGVTLFPNEEATDVFAQHVRSARGRTLWHLSNDFNVGLLSPPAPYADALFRELTDRFFSLSAIGLGTVGPAPLVGMATGFPAVGLSAAEVDVLLRHWIRVQLEARRFLLKTFTPQAVGEDWERPDAIDPGKVTDLVPQRFQAWLNAVLGADGARAVIEWFKAMPTRLASHFWNLNGGLFLTPQMLTLELRVDRDAAWMRCTSCNRLYASSLKNLCSECTGTLEPVSADPTYLDARSGYYRDQVLRALAGDGFEPFGLVTAEHSAQLSGVERKDAFTKTERYELLFQDIPVGGRLPVDVLSCTTTMEVGIDIGTLCGVALRNVPPHVANYQQRAGRAGRRGRSIASVITFAQGGTHDAYYFDHPEEMISGGVRTPVVYIENQVVLARHANAFLVQRYFHEVVASDRKLYRLFESLGTVGAFFDGGEACSYDGMRAWLAAERAVLEAELRGWVPSFSHGLSTPVDVEATVTGAIDRLQSRIEAEFPIPAILGRVPLSDEEREGIARLREDNLLEAFINRAIFPRYAFPTDTVTFWVRERSVKGAQAWRPDFDYLPQRDLTIALTEYAPTRQLTIDKLRFRSAALYDYYGRSPAQMIDRARPYVVCGSCAFTSLRDEDAALQRCPVCASDALRRLPFVRPEGFAPDINEPLRPDRGGSVSLVGQSSPAQLQVEARDRWDESLFDGRLRVAHELKSLVVVNTGIDDRGFLICPTCGRSEPVYGRRFTTPTLVDTKGRPKAHLHPIEQGRTCKSVACGPYFLGHSFRTDVLLLRVKVDAPLSCDPTASTGAAARAALTSLVEALCLAATRSLQIDDGELAGNWSPALGSQGGEADLYLYDVLPGGAGYTRDLRRNLSEVLEVAETSVTACSCASSCYRCLRHYANSRLHGQLDWRLANSLLRHLRRGEVPTMDEDARRRSLDPLEALLRLRGVSFTRDETPEVAPGLTVPMVVRAQGVENWIEVHHPLVDPLANSPVVDGADALGFPVVPLDAWTLTRDLPTAYERACGGG